MPQTHIRTVTRGPRTRLRITFGDGTVFDEQQASDTFALTLRRLGLSRVEQLGIYVRNLPLVGNVKSEGYGSQTEINGKYVCHHMDTRRKKRLLDKTAKQLSTPIKVEIIPNI